MAVKIIYKYKQCQNDKVINYIILKSYKQTQSAMQNNIGQSLFRKCTVYRQQEPPTFTIRKINRKIKNSEDNLFTPEPDHEKCIEPLSFSYGKKEKTNTGWEYEGFITSTKTYQNLKSQLDAVKQRNIQQKIAVMEQINKNNLQKQEALQKYQQLVDQKNKYMEQMASMKEKLSELRETNKKYHQLTQNKMSGEAQYLTNLLMSMRFQAEYEHDINPDQMTYQELLDLQQKMGSVSRGATSAQIAKLQKNVVIRQFSSESLCTVCYCSYEEGEMTNKINCQHEFHWQCLKSWLEKQKVCPVCKQQISFK